MAVNFFRGSATLCVILRHQGYEVINYIDAFIGFGKLEAAKKLYGCLYKILQNLGLTTSKKKLVPPNTKAICLGVMIDTEQYAISIPSEKLAEIQTTVQEWITNTTQKTIAIHPRSIVICSLVCLPCQALR